jgi:hypothetical protein
MCELAHHHLFTSLAPVLLKINVLWNSPTRQFTALLSLGSLLPLFWGQSVHDLSHPGTRATAKLVAQRFVWPGVQKDCCTWARACQACQRSKVSRHTVTPVGDFTLPAARFLHIHIDLVGTLPSLYSILQTQMSLAKWSSMVSTCPGFPNDGSFHSEGCRSYFMSNVTSFFTWNFKLVKCIGSA